MKVFQGEKIPIKNWCSIVEEEAWEQIFNLAKLPFAFHHIAIMPDAHKGYGVPIGGVLATKKVVIPNAVGVDIGCGLCAVKTSLKVEQLDKETLKQIMGKIREVIPVGKEHNKVDQDKALMPTYGPEDDTERYYPIVYSQYHSALKQLGSLGSGNHFLEIQRDTENNIWIMIHSGSRNLGHKVATYYNEVAIKLNEKWYSSVPKEWQLAFLPIDGIEGKAYIREMTYCVNFALANRRLIMDRIIDCFHEILKPQKTIAYSTDMINIAHNYAKMENHFGENVMVHRKGATLARTDIMGIIPGSQGTASYIVQGKGNPDSFMSCSHGAGRTMSRTKAKNELDLATEIKKLNDKGIIHGIRTQKDLDEASGAYKDISQVMAEQSDLIEIKVKLEPLAVIKGD